MCKLTDTMLQQGNEMHKCSPCPPSLASSSPSSASNPIPLPKRNTKPFSASPYLAPSSYLGSSPHSQNRSKRSNTLPSYNSKEEENPISLGDFILQYSSLLPLQMKVKRGHHGGDEEKSIASDDVYNVHFVKRTKVAVLKDRRGATFNIPLNSAVQFAPVFNPSNDPRKPAKEATFQKVSDLMSLKTLPRVVRATKSHVADPRSTIEQTELFVVQGVVPLSVRKKALKVYSITCKDDKLLLPESVGAFTADPNVTCLYLPDLVKHFLRDFPLEVKVVLSNCNMICEELPFYLTNEVATITHLDSETSLIASTNWGENEVVCEEDKMPVEIPVDLPIEVVVSKPDATKETHLSDHTKRLYERFDPSRIRLLKTRNIRRGFEKEGTELQRPERIYDIPDVDIRRSAPPQSADGAFNDNTAPTSPTPSLVSPQMKRFSIPSSPPSANFASSQIYKPPPGEYATLEPWRGSLPLSCRINNSSSFGQSRLAYGRGHGQLPLHSHSLGNGESLESRFDVLEREVYILRAEMAKLQSSVTSSSNSPQEEQRMSKTRRNSIEHLKTLSTEQVADLLQRMKLGQYREIFIEQQITGTILSQCTAEVLANELEVASKIHRLRLLQIITGEISATDL